MNAGSELKSRGKAAGIHFFISFFVIFALLLACFVVWFWPPVYCATGFLKLVWLVFLVDLCAGPLATFVVWKKGKKGLLFDLVVIAMIQSLFLGYGIYTVSKSRPVFYVFVVDDFELVSAAAVIWPDQPVEYKVGLFVPPAFVGARFSGEPALSKRQREDEIFNGISLARRPDAYVPIESRAGDLLAKSRTITNLEKYNDQSSIRVELDGYPDAYAYLPLKGAVDDLSVLINDKGKVLGLVNLTPW